MRLETESHLSKNLPNKEKDIVNFKPLETIAYQKEFKPMETVTVGYDPIIFNPTDNMKMQDNKVFSDIPRANNSIAENTGRFAFTQSSYLPITPSYTTFTVPNMSQQNFQSNKDASNLMTRGESPKSKSIKFRIVDENKKSSVFEKRPNSSMDNDYMNGSVGNALKKLNLNNKTSTIFGGDKYTGTNMPEIFPAQNQIAKSTSIISQIKEYEADSAYKVTISKPGQIFSKDEPNRPRFDNQNSVLKYNPANSFTTSSIPQKSKLSKQKYGRFISYDTILFNGLAFENRDADGFKYACLVNKAALYDSNILQIGTTSSLNSSNLPSDKTFKLTLHYGNKANDEISNFTVFPNSILRNFFH